MTTCWHTAVLSSSYEMHGAIRPKPIVNQPPQIPLDDPEAAALALAEVMPPAMRRELGRLLLAGV